MRPLKWMALALLMAPTALAAQVVDPDWPCVQRKVDHLSLAAMWPLPIPESDERLATDFLAVAEQMALRRVTLDEVGALVDELAAEHPDLDADDLGRIYAEAFRRIDRRRLQLHSGISRYQQGQSDLAEQIDALRVEFAEVEAAAEPDFDRLDALEVEIDWRERLFDERRSSLTYVCETPILLEKRAFEIAHVLLDRAQ